MKKISFLLIFLILLQSCSLYNSPATVGEAVAAEEKVKVFTTDKQKYLFKRLENKDDRLVGINTRGSSSSTKVAGLPTSIDGEFLVTNLSNVDIEQIMLRNKSASTNRTIIAVAASMILAVVTYFIIDFATSPWSFGSGSN